jgi:hypothetical protein
MIPVEANRGTNALIEDYSNIIKDNAARGSFQADPSYSGEREQRYSVAVICCVQEVGHAIGFRRLDAGDHSCRGILSFSDECECA